jgi:hypothetical protein
VIDGSKSGEAIGQPPQTGYSREPAPVDRLVREVQRH